MKTTLWAALGAVLLAMPAAAQHDPANAMWRKCVVDEMKPHEMTSTGGSVGYVAVRLAQRCQVLYLGPKDDDVHTVVALLEKLRSQQPKEFEMVIEPARPLPPGDKRF